MRSRRASAWPRWAQLSLLLAACGSNGGSGGGPATTIAVTLITKTSTNPFFVAMQKGAKEAGEENGVDITTAAGKEDGDERRPDRRDRGRGRPRRQGHPDHAQRPAASTRRSRRPATPACT